MGLESRMDDWRRSLRNVRRARHLSQRSLAELSGLSTETVRGYESGRRKPARDHLMQVLDALKVSRAERSEILEDAGFATDTWHLGSLDNPGFYFTIEEALEEIQLHPWPAFVNNEWAEVVVANDVAQRLWGVDLRHEFTDAIDRNMLSLASTPRFADRCVNWDEAIGVLASVWKGHHRGPEDPETPSPYFASVMERFLKGDPKYVARFAECWQSAEPATPKVRWWYPIVWDEPGIGTMRFRCLSTTCDEPRGLAYQDWMPLDAATWHALDTLRAAGG